MQIALPELTGPATLILDPEHGLSDEEYVAICEANPGLWIERTSNGQLIVSPPVGGETDYRTVDAGAQLHDWSRRNGSGRAFGATAGFFLPDGSALCPDAAWVSNARLSTLIEQQRRGLLRLVPEFIVEVLSPSDRLPAARQKMRVWIANGVELGWLIDGDEGCVYIFRKGGQEEVVRDAERIPGEGPVEGFVLELREIWEGL